MALSWWRRRLPSAAAPAMRAPAFGRLQPEDVTLRLEDGLLMAFGPRGDPITPRGIAALIADWPAAELLLADGRRVAGARAAAVLAAQKGGCLAPAAATPWLLAMLGLGAQPAPAEPGLLAAEPAGAPAAGPAGELWLTLAGGGTLRLLDPPAAAAGGPAVLLQAADGAPLSVAGLRARLGRRLAAGEPAALVADGWAVTVDGSGLVIEIAPLAGLLLVDAGATSPAPPAVRLELPSVGAIGAAALAAWLVARRRGPVLPAGAAAHRQSGFTETDGSGILELEKRPEDRPRHRAWRGRKRIA
jgi:hypothetical protein